MRSHFNLVSCNSRVPGEVVGWKHLLVTGVSLPGVPVPPCVGKDAPREEFLPAVSDVRSDFCLADV